MARTLDNNTTLNDIFNGAGNGFVSGGAPAIGDISVSQDGGTYVNDGTQWNSINTQTMMDPTVRIPDNGEVHIGDDFKMTGKEFKICMKMLRKMAMKECPEEFI